MISSTTIDLNNPTHPIRSSLDKKPNSSTDKVVSTTTSKLFSDMKNKPNIALCILCAVTFTTGAIMLSTIIPIPAVMLIFAALCVGGGITTDLLSESRLSPYTKTSAGND